MRKKIVSLSLIILGTILFSFQGFAQTLELKSSKNGENVFEIVDKTTFKNLISPSIKQNAAFRNFLAQEVAKDSDIISVSRINKGQKSQRTFSITTKNNLSAEELEAKLISTISQVNLSLQDYLQKGMSTDELSNFIKSELIEEIH